MEKGYNRREEQFNLQQGVSGRIAMPHYATGICKSLGSSFADYGQTHLHNPSSVFVIIFLLLYLLHSLCSVFSYFAFLSSSFYTLFCFLLHCCVLIHLFYLLNDLLRPRCCLLFVAYFRSFHL